MMSQAEPVIILLVEDDPAHAEAVKCAFLDSGMKTKLEVAGSLLEYRGRVAAHPPHIAIMDLNLPDGHAIEALSSQPEDRPFPILLITGFGDERVAVEAMKAGAIDYVVKSSEAFAAMPRTVERALREWNLLQGRKRAEKNLLETNQRLSQAITATIQVLSMTVEARDPYTAGHQRRTTILAEAIAGEMGFPPEKIEGLRMAGKIHDIGKISVPSEILSKPAKLNPAEYELVKAHALKGYEILKEVESPWPLAEIVYQHHERMNGSGYPRGLKGDEILLEARILAVSDTVEAMASHRPYRFAPGVEAALEEIDMSKGVLYDSDVAAACLKLFREKGFIFEA
jgi:HD-GYP domain-containing protein (c-di-GMP phosphodiesterase class II)